MINNLITAWSTRIATVLFIATHRSVDLLLRYRSVNMVMLNVRSTQRIVCLHIFKSIFLFCVRSNHLHISASNSNARSSSIRSIVTSPAVICICATFPGLAARVLTTLISSAAPCALPSLNLASARNNNASAKSQGKDIP